MSRQSRVGPRPLVLRASIVLALAGLVVAGCSSASGSGSSGGTTSEGSGSGSAATDPVIIYGAAGISGAFAASSGPIVAGMNAAVAVINADGGLLGRQVEVSLDNSQSDATKAVSLLTARLAQEPKPDLVYTGSSSIECLPVLPLLTENKIVSNTGCSGADIGDPAKNPYSFSASMFATTQAKILADYLVQQNYKSIAFIGSDTVVTDTFRAAQEAAFAAAGITVVAAEKFDPSSVDVTAQLSGIKESNPDAVVINGVGTTQYVLKSRIKAGMTDVPFVGDSSANILDLSTSVTPEEAEGYVGATYSANLKGGGGPGLQTLVDQLGKNGVDITGTIAVYGLGYDLVMSWANGVVQAGTLDSGPVKDAMVAGGDAKYPLSLYTSTGWTADDHFVVDLAAYTFAPISPLKDGQFTAS